MDHNLTPLLAGCIAFVGTHFALSHPLRAPLVKVFGENGFLGLYSLTALATFGWMIAAFRAAGPVEGQLWDGGNGFFWLVSSLLTFVALALLLGSLRGNPALPQTSASTLTNARASGVFAVTRHPMMWGFALWAIAHMLVAPKPRTLLLAGSLAVLALVGAHLQDRKKAALLGKAWTEWEAKTSYWPSFDGLFAVHPILWAVTAVLWLIVTKAHMPLITISAGIWRWVG